MRPHGTHRAQDPAGPSIAALKPARQPTKPTNPSTRKTAWASSPRRYPPSPCPPHHRRHPAMCTHLSVPNRPHGWQAVRNVKDPPGRVYMARGSGRPSCAPCCAHLLPCHAAPRLQSASRPPPMQKHTVQFVCWIRAHGLPAAASSYKAAGAAVSGCAPL